MLQYRSFEEIIDHPGLRIVLVKGMPSPWGQAAKTIFEIKGLDYVAAPWQPGEANENIVAWSGEASGPIVAWAKEKPINRWIDILYLAERLAPKPSLVPADGTQRALMIGLSHEICGEMGIGWNRRLQLFAPAYASGNPPAGVSRMGNKYGYNEGDAKAAGERTAVSLRALATQLKSQYARGVHYFIGDSLSALDIYWVAFAICWTRCRRSSARCPRPTDPASRSAMRSSRQHWTRCCWNTGHEFSASTIGIQWSCKPRASKPLSPPDMEREGSSKLVLRNQR
jgi:glutathione S-transferase